MAFRAWCFAFGLLCSVQAGAQETHWYRGNTHTHTMNSDGDATPDSVARWYREHGYDFLFITDHEYLADASALSALVGGRDRFLILPGQEITQWSDDPTRSAAHINGLFVGSVIYPLGSRRCIGSGCGAYVASDVPLAATFQANISAVLRDGGIAQVNHPNYRWSVQPSDLDGVPNGTLLEIWNGQGRINNLGGDNGEGDVRPSAEGYWDYLLSKGKIVWGVGSDDSHSFKVPEVNDRSGSAPGQAWIMVRAAALTPEAIKFALKSGNFYASTGVELGDISTNSDSLTITIEASGSKYPARFVTKFIGQSGHQLAAIAGAKAIYRFSGNETYVRAVVTDSNGRSAWTQPVFFDARKEWKSKQR